MVIFSHDLAILTVKVLVYREAYGGEIGSKRWLEQFTGKKNGRGMEYGKNIQGISGATISALSISSGIKKLSLNMQELRKSGVI
jgi:Na+-translocating ferredoxin:NAD+ oxidoreductase RnfG subunit